MNKIPNKPTDLDTLPAILISLARVANGFETDEVLGARIGVGSGAVSAWRLGRQPIPERHVVSLAELTGDPVELWLARIMSDRSRNTVAREAWQRVVERLESAA